jgi:hypothetical protein
MKALGLALLVACAPQATRIGPDHPANPAAETGRLAGPPSALRPGVATVDAPAKQPAPSPAAKPAHH